MAFSSLRLHLAVLLILTMNSIVMVESFSNPAFSKKVLVGRPQTPKSLDLAQKMPAFPAMGTLFKRNRRRKSTTMIASSSTTSNISTSNHLSSSSSLHPVQANLTKALMILYIASMCITLPLTLSPLYLLYKLRIISTTRKENLALRTGCFCSRWCLRLLPFCRLRAIPTNVRVGNIVNGHNVPQDPCVWVCNHTSMLDVFVLMAADHKLRGSKRRPLKIVYWKGLESNPVTKLLFRMCGFLPVNMTANAPGENNEYDTSSFKNLLRSSKKAFEEGFDIGILPEGQLNPNPEKGLLPIFKGAFTLAKLSRRPIQMMSLFGTHRLWHPNDMDLFKTKVEGRNISVRAYPLPKGHRFTSGDEFEATFQNVVGHFGMYGKDLEEDELEQWLDGRAWSKRMAEEEHEGDKK